MNRARILTKDSEAAGGFGAKHLDFALEIKADAVKADGEFEGYASVWNVVDQGGDAVQPGAFTEGLVKAKADGRLIPMLWQHDRTRPIGTWTDMSEDSKGLWVSGKLLIDAVPDAKMAHGLLQAKAIGGLSIGYRVPVGGMEEDSKRRGVWLLKKVDLVEVSLVTMPMLVQAKVTAVKNILESGRIPTVREFEGFLQSAGFPRALAEGISGKAAPLLRGEPAGGSEADALVRFEQAMKAAGFGGSNSKD